MSFPNANYTVMRVYPDGNPEDLSHHGTDLAAALRERDRVDERRHDAIYLVYDADDPERGYFDEVPG